MHISRMKTDKQKTRCTSVAECKRGSDDTIANSPDIQSPSEHDFVWKTKCNTKLMAVSAELTNHDAHGSCQSNCAGACDDQYSQCKQKAEQDWTWRPCLLTVTAADYHNIKSVMAFVSSIVQHACKMTASSHKKAPNLGVACTRHSSV